MADVQMPQLGETVTEGTITKWFKQVGESVAMDEVLFEVSTDKVDSEVPSPIAGVLAEIRVPEGETVDVGTVIAVVTESKGEGASTSAPPPTAPKEASAEAPAEPAEPAPAPKSAAAPAPSAPAPAPAVAKTPPPAPPPAASAPPSAPVGAGALVSPVVRRLIDGLDLDINTVQGTGVGGRITRSDVERTIASGAVGVAPAPKQAASTSSDPDVKHADVSPRAAEGDTIETLNNIRRRTGDHMKMSKDTSPHAMTAVEVDYERVERARRAYRAEWKTMEGFGLTYLPFIARAVIDALRDFPHMNATVGDGELIVHNYVNLSIAVDLDFEGLLAPVIHGADDKRMRAIARDIYDLADRARSKRLSADDISGGTFTITNAGAYGTHMVIPIINQPQVAILSTDGVSRKPVVVNDVDGNEAIAIHSVGILALSWDHRAFDGAYAAAFMALIKQILETRDWESELA